MRRWRSWAPVGAVLAFAGVLAAGSGAKRAAPPGVDASAYLNTVRKLAADDMKGRGTGRPELQAAAQYLAAEFRKAGLQPAGSNGYLQPFAVTVNARLEEGNRFAWTSGAEREELAAETGFTPFSFSASGEYQGGVVFAGYGITAPEYGYNDYENLEVRGRAVLVLRHEPQEFDRASILEGRIYTEHSQTASKVANAVRHGASAVIFVNDTANHSGGDVLERCTAFAAPGRASVPVVQVRAETVEAWFRASARDFSETQQRIDRELRPASFAFPHWLQVQLSARVRSEQRTVFNVAGYLPGQTPEYVVIGAHYDHLGLGEQFSLAAGGVGTTHPGADDNASGTAGVLELARWFRGQSKPRRGFLFLAFAAEEIGLLGSGHYVRNPLLPAAGAVAMINLDMIGRLRDSQVVVGASRSGQDFAELLRGAEGRSDLKLDTSEDVLYGSSDHTSFLTLPVPVLFFFTGLHGDYHRPSDTWDRIDAAGAARVLDLVADVAMRLASAPERPVYVRQTRSQGQP